MSSKNNGECRDVISPRGAALLGSLMSRATHPGAGWLILNYFCSIYYYFPSRSAARCEYLPLAFSPADGRRKGKGAYLHNSARRAEGTVAPPRRGGATPTILVRCEDRESPSKLRRKVIFCIFNLEVIDNLHISGLQRHSNSPKTSSPWVAVK